MEKTFITSLLFACAITANAQMAPIKITDAKALDHALNVRRNKGVEAALQSEGIHDDQAALVLEYGDHDYWPVGIRSDTARKRNAPYIQNYTCFKLCSVKTDTVAMQVVMVPAKENLHMPEDMRPLADFYLLLPERATGPKNVAAQRPEISRGPKWKDLPQAKIIKADELYATYDMAKDSAGMAALAKRGMSPAEIDAVVFRSTDRNWPDGIDDFTERQALLDKFPKYTCYLGAKWDNKVLLIVPTEKNKHVPILMRPYVDLYFVYNVSAVEVKKK